MTRRVSVERIEREGVEAVCQADGQRREGWVMAGRHFVDYAGFAQLVWKLDEVTNLEYKRWSRVEAPAPRRTRSKIARRPKKPAARRSAHVSA